MNLYEGFIVHASYQTVKGQTRIFYLGRLRTGETFAIVEERAKPSLYIRAGDEDAAREILGQKNHEVAPSGCTTIDGEEALRVSWRNISNQQDGNRTLLFGGVRTYEGDIRFYDQHLIDSQVFGSVAISGEPVKGRKVDWVFHNPAITQSEWAPKLSVLSVDIENNPNTGQILSISMASDETWRNDRYQHVLFLGSGITDRNVTCFDDERSLLEAFQTAVREVDPDIITGWNVLEFDFLHLTERFAFHSLPFTMGRSDQTGNFLPGGKGQSSAVIIPGRQVIDAMRVMRAGPMSFEDNRLETVATEVLGTGKVEFTEEENLKGKKKIAALLKTYREDPETFCRYSLKDAVLVIDILEATGLMELTVGRARFTGIGLARAWTSVAAFEHLYIASMHKNGLVAPTHGVDTFEVRSAPGGGIIAPQPGLYDNVLVFDFKSLYPSIMRTFNVDPVSYVSSHSNLDGLNEPDLIQAPNGAYFRRDRAILPDILSAFFEKRETAKQNSDQVASYVYKIIMNSFYGVLGTSGCRFAASDIAGAITSFGQHFLTWCQQRLEALGNRVIYGDTDSLFVLLSPALGTGVERLIELGQQTADELNREIQGYIRDTWDVDSKLELEFEGIYTRFFMPPIRGSYVGSRSQEGGQVRGRAKGYAGLRLTGVSEGEASTEFEIKGMEAVRRDWTTAAKNLQIELLKMAFRNDTLDAIRAYVQEYIQDLKSGTYDGDLVYRKALRKSVASYDKSKPPHVKAALALDPEDQTGVIEYLWTVAGPEPVERQTHPIDYTHYLEKQLRPVSEALSFTLQADLESLFKDDKQSALF